MATSNAFHETAPAKVNLALHITGRRNDGYHLLDSLVVFTEYGDRLDMVAEGYGLHLQIDGPFAQSLDAHDNIILDAARLMLPDDAGASITLTKNLPVAAGIGGGSADAAAMLRLAARVWNRPLPKLARQLGLGADVPVCMTSTAQHMRGIGEDLTALPWLKGLHLVLVNPGIALRTPDVFARIDTHQNAPMSPLPNSVNDFASWLGQQRNDMQSAAVSLCPVIADCLAALGGHGAQIARMSGSGTTCYGVFEDAYAANAAARAIEQMAPGWWVRATGTR
ncbi:MAG: 4-(cytidine 5'-diphospho)-2-C-methyl-D-erythritol kinase [Paracoccaceae bacterium]